MSEYKRMTKKDDKGRWVANAGHFCVYHDDKSPSVADMMFGEIVNRLAELENKIESGDLVELPKKVFLGNDKFVGNEYAVITTTFRLFCDEQQADAFLEREKERLRGGEANE